MALALPAAVICAACTGFLTSGSNLPDTLATALGWACGAPKPFSEAAQETQGTLPAGVKAIYFGGTKASAVPGALICGAAQ